MLRTVCTAAVAAWIVGISGAQAQDGLSSPQARLTEAKRQTTIVCRPLAARSLRIRRVAVPVPPFLPERPVARFAAVDPVVLGVGF